MSSLQPPTNKCRIAVFVSGNGTNLQALVDHCKSGDIKGEIAAVVSNVKYAFALTRARNENIETLIFEPDQKSSRTELGFKIAKALKERNIDLICLAGYMMKIEPSLIRAFPNRIINIHPALLPKYGGKGMFGHHVHEAVITAKEKESGCTVHLVDEQFDHGPILGQAKVLVSPDETPESLAEKIYPKEHDLYVSIVKKICSGALNLDTVPPVTEPS